MFLLLAGSLGFVLGGVFILLSGDGSSLFVGLSSIAFFGGCALVATKQLLDARPRLVIDDRGVLDRTLKVGVIAWNDILDAQVATLRRQSFVALRLRNEASYTDRLSPILRRLTELNRQFPGFTTLNISVSTLDVEPQQLASLIAQEAESRRTPPNDPYRGEA